MNFVTLHGHVLVDTGHRILTGNVVEVQMYATMGGQFMRMHPVIIMVPEMQVVQAMTACCGTPCRRLHSKALIMLFSSLLGITGMFLAAWLQTLSDFVTTALLGNRLPVLAF